MGLLKLALIVLLISVSVNGLEDPIVNEDEKVVSENTIDKAQDVAAEEPTDAIDEEPPVEILTENEPLLVRSGRYQLSDDTLSGGAPIDTDAMSFGTADGTQNERQLLQPSTTSPTGVINEYGKHDIMYLPP